MLYNFPPLKFRSKGSAMLRVMLLLASVCAVGMTSAFADQQRSSSEIGQIVRDYIIQNPEIIEEALHELERRRTEEENAQRLAAITDNSELIFNSQNHFVAGNPDGDVTLVEFFDYNCGFCKRALADLNRLMEEDKNLRIVFKEFPVLSRGSVEAAEVSFAVSRVAPDKYMALHRDLLNARGENNGARARRIASDLGVDMAALEAEVASEEVRQSLSEVYAIAQALGINGTPSYIIGTEVLPGAIGYDEIKRRVDAMRICGSTHCG